MPEGQIFGPQNIWKSSLSNVSLRIWTKKSNNSKVDQNCNLTLDHKLRREIESFFSEIHDHVPNRSFGPFYSKVHFGPDLKQESGPIGPSKNEIFNLPLGYPIFFYQKLDWEIRSV